VLQLQGAGTTTQSQINYNFYANSSLKNISSTSPVSIMTGSGVTPTQGTRIPIKVVIQSVSGKDPGTYQDYVTFTIATTE
jgi:spore coat protein U-like protein